MHNPVVPFGGSLVDELLVDVFEDFTELKLVIEPFLAFLIEVLPLSRIFQDGLFFLRARPFASRRERSLMIRLWIQTKYFNILENV